MRTFSGSNKNRPACSTNEPGRYDATLTAPASRTELLAPETLWLCRRRRLTRELASKALRSTRDALRSFPAGRLISVSRCRASWQQPLDGFCRRPSQRSGRGVGHILGRIREKPFRRPSRFPAALPGEYGGRRPGSGNQRCRNRLADDRRGQRLADPAERLTRAVAVASNAFLAGLFFTVRFLVCGADFDFVCFAMWAVSL